MSMFRPLALCALLAPVAFGLAGCDSASDSFDSSFDSAQASVSGTVQVVESDITRQAENTTPTDNWVFFTRAGTPATAGAFRSGPATPPLGTGSFELITATGAEKGFLFNFDHVGTPLSQINEIGYSTYRTAGSAQQVAALNMVIDFNGATTVGFTTLVFEPVYNTAQGAVVSGQWQTWNASGSGTWWSTRAINGQCAGATDTCDKTWAEIQANNPDATVLGGFGVNQGSGNAGLTTAVDKLTIGNAANAVVYDFELSRMPANRDACKNDGWMGLTDAEGNPFRNQGQCVAYVNRS